MRFSSSPRPVLISVLAGLLLLVMGIQILWFVSVHSATYDEPYKIAAGYAHLTLGAYDIGNFNPPLIQELSALPLLFLGPSFPLDHEFWLDRDHFGLGSLFLYRNRAPAGSLLFWARIPSLTITLLLGLLVFTWGRRAHGSWAGLTSLALFAFSPNFLGHGGLATNDVATSLFFFLTAYAFWRYTESSKARHLVLTAIALGLALATKFSSLILIPILLLLWVLRRRFERIWLFLVVVAGALVLVAATYRFSSFAEFWRGITIQWQFFSGGQPAYFAGEYASDGWWSYYPVAFLLKSTLAFLALLALVLVFRATSAAERIRRSDLFLLLPPAVFFAACIQSNLNLGIRYVFPVYPFLYVLAGDVVNWRLRGRAAGRLVASAFIAFHVMAAVSIAPHYFSFFNVIAGGPDGGRRYLVDSNTDWGQELVGLSGFVRREKVSDLILCYFGTADPAAHGLTYQDLDSIGIGEGGTQAKIRGHDEHLNSPNPSREILAVSVTNLAAVDYPDKDRFAWLDGREPLAAIGHSILLYEITEDPQAHFRLARTYLLFGHWHHAARETERLLILDPSNRKGAIMSLLLGSLESGREDRPQEAISRFRTAIELAEEQWDEFEQDMVIEPAVALGEALLETGAGEEALVVFGHLLDFVADDKAFVELKIGETQAALGRPDEARDSYLRAISLDPEFAGPHYALGLLHLAENDETAAIESFRRAIDLVPTFDLPYQALYRLHLRRNRPEEAEAILEAAREHGLSD